MKLKNIEESFAQKQYEKKMAQKSEQELLVNAQDLWKMD